MIRHLAVVIPVHDEQELLEDCLDAVTCAMDQLPPFVRARCTVVLDDCTDDSLAIVQRHGDARIAPVAARYRNVGRTRAHGVGSALRQCDAAPLEQIWISATDADSRVPLTWLADQVALADMGIDAVAGVVEVREWENMAAAAVAAYESFYRTLGGSEDTHGHVHGANLGIRASAYRGAGGFPPLPSGEDCALWHAVRALGYCTVATRRLSVVTSSRRLARAPGGFSYFLDRYRSECVEEA